MRLENVPREVRLEERRMSEKAESKSGGISPVILIIIVIAVIFCCLCVLGAAVAVWLINSSDIYFEDWEYWSSLLQLIS